MLYAVQVIGNRGCSLSSPKRSSCVLFSYCWKGERRLSRIEIPLHVERKETSLPALCSMTTDWKYIKKEIYHVGGMWMEFCITLNISEFCLLQYEVNCILNHYR